MIRAAVKRDCHRVRSVVCVKRISTFILVLGLLGSLLLVYFGMIGYVPEIFCGVGLAMFGLTTPAILYIWCEANDRTILRCLVKRTTHACQVLSGRSRKRARATHHFSYDNPTSVADDEMNQPSFMMEQMRKTVKEVQKADKSQSIKNDGVGNQQAEVMEVSPCLAQDGIRASPVVLNGKARLSLSLPTGFSTTRNMQRALDGPKMAPILGAISEPFVYEPVPRTKHVSGDGIVRPIQSPQTLQQAPEQGPYSHVENLQMPKSSEVISELGLNHPGEKPGLHVLQCHETPVDQFSLISQ